MRWLAAVLLLALVGCGTLGKTTQVAINKNVPGAAVVYGENLGAAVNEQGIQLGRQTGFLVVAWGASGDWAEWKFVIGDDGKLTAGTSAGAVSKFKLSITVTPVSDGWEAFKPAECLSATFFPDGEDAEPIPGCTFLDVDGQIIFAPDDPDLNWLIVDEAQLVRPGVDGDPPPE